MRKCVHFSFPSWYAFTATVASTFSCATNYLLDKRVKWVCAADDGAATTTHAGQDQTMIAPKPIEVQEVR